MFIKDIEKNKDTVLSFEIFPPKPDTPFESVTEAARKLALKKPDFISVTYGAGGSSRDNTFALASFIQDELNVTSLAHLTCVGTAKETLGDILSELSERKIQNILALRGDFPPGQDDMCLDFKHASDLISEIKKFDDFCVGGACYPEGHTESDNIVTDIENLKYKTAAGVDFLVSQLYFDNDVFYNFLYRAAARGIEVPVHAGIMPVVNRNSVKRMCRLSGATLTPKYRNMLDTYYDKPESLRKAGIVYASEQIIDLVANGVSGIHIYTMNKPDIAEEIMYNLKGII